MENSTSFVVQRGANGSSCKVFFPPGNNVGYTAKNNSNPPVDDPKLVKDGSGTVWWLRTPNSGTLK